MKLHNLRTNTFIVLATALMLSSFAQITLYNEVATERAAEEARLAQQKIELAQRKQQQKEEYARKQREEKELVQTVKKLTSIQEEAFALRVTRALKLACAEFGVNIKIMASLIGVESSGDPSAISKVGAIGLTQIMPATGKQIAQQLKIPWEGEATLLDPEMNIRFGVFYMSQLLDLYQGNVYAALAAYNWGPGNISRRISSGALLPTNYPNKVMKQVEL